MSLPTVRQLLSDGHGDRHIASTLGVTRHRARVLMTEAQAAQASRVGEVPVDLCYSSPTARPIKPGVVLVLASSIKEIGLRQPINVRPINGGFEIRGGGHRHAAFVHLGRETIPAIVSSDDDLRAELAEIDENLIRNELSPAERAIAVSRRKAIYEVLHPETQHGSPGVSRQVGDTRERKGTKRFTKETSTATGQSERTVQREAQRGEALGDGLLAQVTGTCLDKGDEIDALAKLSSNGREVIVRRAAAGEKVSAKVAVKQERRAAREAELGAAQLTAPRGKFGVIVEDYEWDHVTWSEAGKDRHAGNHYPTSRDAHTAQEIVERTKDRWACAADDCVAWMWATIPHLAIAIDVLRLRGLDYKSHYIWGKDKIITGYWSRAKHEVLLIGVKGNIPCPAMGTQEDSLLYGPSGIHSEKPECIMEMIERYFPTVPKLELNSRKARKGWTVWGLDANANANEVEQ